MDHSKFLLILSVHRFVFGNFSTAIRTGLGQRSLDNFVGLVIGKRGPMAMDAVLFAGTSAPGFGVRLGRPFGKRSSLAFVFSLGLFEFLLELLIFVLEAMVISPELLVFGLKL